jgi:hypothetical protein
MIQAPVLGWTPPAYDDIVNTYGMDILTVPGDFSIVAGDLAMTKDGDFKMGDTTYNGLFRLVQAWRYNVHHLRFLFEMMHAMSVHRRRLDDKMNRIGEERHARFSINAYLQPDPIFAEAFHAVTDERGTAEFGFGTFAGCLVMLLSGSLLRFKDDIDASANDWTRAEPLFNGVSLGQVVVAAANGFRHDDEWAKTRPPTPKQKVSQDIIVRALQGRPAPEHRTPGRCAEVLGMLSQDGNFERLAANLFAFAHNVALSHRSRQRPVQPA